MTRPEIKSLSHWPLANTQPTRPMNCLLKTCIKIITASYKSLQIIIVIKYSNVYNCLKKKWIFFHWMSEFNGMSTRQELFHAKKLNNSKYFTLKITFFVQFLLWFSFWEDRLYDIKYSYLIQTICQQVIYIYMYIWLINEVLPFQVRVHLYSHHQKHFSVILWISLFVRFVLLGKEQVISQTPITEKKLTFALNNSKFVDKTKWS